MTTPEQPYDWYLRERAEDLRASLAGGEPLRSAHAGASEDLRSRVAEHVDGLAGDLVGLSHRIHGDPELGFAEHRAAAAVTDLLAYHGHDAAVGVGGLDTALRATAGGDGPRIAVLAEYDALPGVGHGCGHNIICATAVGAFLAAAEAVEVTGGTVVLLGTPAEEGGGGKELLARAGEFDDVDAAVMLHPWGFDVAEHTWLGRRRVTVGFRGLAAHAATMPYLGRNALDAAVSAYTLLGLLRQHLLPGDLLHAVISEGGDRPNIVPEHAELSVYLRSPTLRGLTELCDRAQAIFEGAAAATGTVLEAQWDPAPPYLPVRSNHALAARYAHNLADRRDVLPAGIVPADLTGSTDMGNVSVRVPSIHPMLGIAPPETGVHTREFARWAGSEDGDRGVVDGALGLALTVVDFLADGDLRAAVAAEFAAAGGPVDVPELFG